MIRLCDMLPDAFYWLDEMAASSLFDAVLDWSAKQTGASLTLSYTVSGALESQHHRLQHIAGKLDQIRILATGLPCKNTLRDARIEYRDTTGTPLAQYRIALVESRTPRLFIAREKQRSTPSGITRSLGFITSNTEIINEIADDIDALAHGMGRRLEIFERLEKLHQTTQRVTRELESYSRRLQLAVERAHRRPDLLTPARFERIVAQTIIKMEELKEIPRRALRSMNKRRRL
jgi:hypothetical protein